MDIWYAFACYGIDLISNNGCLCFIATNNWTTNAGASKMRHKILTQAKVKTLIDFGDYKVFESAGIQTMVMLFQKNCLENEYLFDYRHIVGNKFSTQTISNILSKTSSYNNEIYYNNINRKELENKLITFCKPAIQNIIDKICIKPNFKLYENELAQGIVFPQDFLNKKNLSILGENFFLNQGIFALSKDELTKLKLSTEEYSLIKPYYTSSDLKKYFGNKENQHWIIYTGSQFKNPDKMYKYPNLKSHLDRFKDVITSDNKPYGLHRARDKNFFLGEKIIALRKCSGKPVFTYTNFDCYVSATFYAIKTSRINQRFLTAFLNSELCAFWLRHKGKMQGNNYQIDKEPLINIPIPNLSPEDQQFFINLVDIILSKKERGEGTVAEESQIDQMVYKLYDLTPEEIAIVEGHSG